MAWKWFAIKKKKKKTLGLSQEIADMNNYPRSSFNVSQILIHKNLICTE